ncbi:type VI secretion system baseplate subunit TssE [Dyella sp.]|uniref:type VI secretion system baseplate subunit TssE n=1 Tax=Dyella sp. TaxID=1869338 RepID=UPI002ED07827
MRSVLDRLADKPLPEDSGRAISLTEFRELVSRDLDALLNTRSEAARVIPEAFEACRQSSLTYGIPDFSSSNLLSPRDRDRIRRSLEAAISLHEPRLTRVRVVMEAQRAYERALRFRVEALVHFGGEREKVQFDAVLQINTQSYQVS